MSRLDVETPRDSGSAPTGWIADLGIKIDRGPTMKKLKMEASMLVPCDVLCDEDPFFHFISFTTSSRHLLLHRAFTLFFDLNFESDISLPT